MPIEDTKLLESAFQEFSKASDSVINYYSVLEAQIRQLKRDVERKNDELEEARKYLHDILDSLPVGVVVLERNHVLFSNRNAEKLGSDKLLNNLNDGGRKAGEIKNGKGQFRWKKETLTNGFSGKEVIVFEDVTEFERMKERVERDERLMAMGEMAARIAHEIKNPLGSMELFLSMLANGKMRVKDKKYVNYVQFGVKTIDRIINNILSYTRPKTLVLKEEKISEIVKDTLDFMSVSILTRGINIQYNASYDDLSFFDPDLMKLVVMNFISNAIEAVQEDGYIKIDINDEGKYAQIAISDNGYGMSEDVRKNMFNPFFTTKDKGMGLGLFIVYNIVKAHGGFIEVESAEAVGSTFFINIPKDKI